jgi:uncharacterized protein
MFNYQNIIDKYYPADTPLRDIYIRHCQSVANKALALAAANQLNINSDDIMAAAMLHDIGIVLTDAPGIHCHGTAPYLAHGYLGADLLRRENAPEQLALVAERHTGTGLTPENVIQLNGIIPANRTYMPQTQLERLVCYADKFFSKSGDMTEKPLERVIASIKKFGDDALNRFFALKSEFEP